MDIYFILSCYNLIPFYFNFCHSNCFSFGRFCFIMQRVTPLMEIPLHIFSEDWEEDKLDQQQRCLNLGCGHRLQVMVYFVQSTMLPVLVTTSCGSRTSCFRSFYCLRSQGIPASLEKKSLWAFHVLLYPMKSLLPAY